MGGRLRARALGDPVGDQRRNGEDGNHDLHVEQCHFPQSANRSHATDYKPVRLAERSGSHLMKNSNSRAKTKQILGRLSFCREAVCAFLLRKEGPSKTNQPWAAMTG